MVVNNQSVSEMQQVKLEDLDRNKCQSAEETTVTGVWSVLHTVIGDTQKAK